MNILIKKRLEILSKTVNSDQLDWNHITKDYNLLFQVFHGHYNFSIAWTNVIKHNAHALSVTRQKLIRHLQVLDDTAER